MRLFKIGCIAAVLWLALNAFTLTQLVPEARQVGPNDSLLRAKVTALQMSPYAALVVIALIVRSAKRRHAERLAELEAGYNADREQFRERMANQRSRNNAMATNMADETARDAGRHRGRDFRRDREPVRPPVPAEPQEPAHERLIRALRINVAD